MQLDKAAGQVCRNLKAAGFIVNKVPGFGRKRERLIGYKHSMSRSFTPRKLPQRAIVIGAGIAGCTVAYELALRGIQVQVLETSDACALGASGNEVGILYPRLEIAYSPSMKLYLQGLEAATRLLCTLQNNGFSQLWERCGILQLPKSEKDIVRFARINKLLYSELLDYLHGKDVSTQAGVALNFEDALLLSNTGYVYPRLWCEALLQHSNIDVHYNCSVKRLQQTSAGWEVYADNISTLQADIVVAAHGYNVVELEQMAYLKSSLQRARGQLSYIPACQNSKLLNRVLCGIGGYVTPAINGIHYVGATYDYEDLSCEPNLVGHQYNLKIWQSYLPQATILDPTTLQGRAAIRCVSKDRLPIITEVPECAGLYISVAHGSRGMLSAPLAAQEIAAMVCGQ